MAMRRGGWTEVRSPLPGRRRAILVVLSFLIPIGAWCAVSYVPWIWHPMVAVTDPGGTYLSAGKLYDRKQFGIANGLAVRQGHKPAAGTPANPVFLPAPHRVLAGFYEAFTKPPQLRDEEWLHQSLWHSIRILLWGYALSMALGIPLGVLAGTFDLFSKLTEPVVDFIRYMPAPLFGALMVAILGVNDAPKIAIIFIGTFFQAVLIIANTTRQLDRTLLETAQTLGATKKRLVTKVILPGILPNLYTDGRILLGWAWTWLIVAELIGEKSGITAYISQQARYFNFHLVYPAMLIIGLIGLSTDQALQAFGRVLFPYKHLGRNGRRRVRRGAAAPDAAAARLLEPPGFSESQGHAGAKP